MKYFNFSKRKLNLRKLLASGGKNCKKILESIFLPISFLCMAIAFTLFLGELFHKIQPWFGVGQGCITFLFGLWGLWDAHRISKTLSISYKKAWSNPKFRFSVDIGIDSLIVSIFAFFIAKLKDPDLYWASAILFILGMGLVCLFSYRMLRLEYLKNRDDKKYSIEMAQLREEKAQLTDATHLGVIVGLSVAGLLHIVIFLPLTLWSAANHSLNSVDVLLFTWLPEVHWSSFNILTLLSTTMTKLVDFSNPSYMFAYIVFYGVIGITIVLVKVSNWRSGEWLKSPLVTGLSIGYVLTIWIRHLIVGVPFTSNVLFPSMNGLAYVFFLYCGLRLLLDVISQWGIKLKYEYLIGGIQSIGTAWILSLIIGDQAIVLTGMIFFVCTFVATSVCEAITGSLFVKEYTALPDQRVELLTPIVLTMVRERHSKFLTSLCFTALSTGIFPLSFFGIAKIIMMGL